MAKTAAFVEGSTMRHVLVMTSTSTIGLMTLFLVDLADMYFLSLLGEVELAAAIGYAGSILFFTTSLCIAVAIAMAALVSRRVGAGEEERARRTVANVFVAAFVLVAPIAALVWIEVETLLQFLGAEGRALELATSYLRIILPSSPILALGMAAGGALRAIGEARRAMYGTLAGGLVNAVLDPIFIFGFALGVDGAAIASVLARFAVVGVSLYLLVEVRGFIAPFERAGFFRDLPDISRITLPAILTNTATPVGNAFMTIVISSQGVAAVAGYSVVGRLMPVAFGALFALSGAVGPIVGQNFGANKMDRVRQTLLDAVTFAGALTLIAWLILALSRDVLASAFSLDGDAASVLRFFCLWVAPTYFFFGLLFVANASFNNLGKPMWSAFANWGRATVGTIPFALLGATVAGAEGALMGQGAGALLFGAGAFFMAWRLSGGVGAQTGDASERARFFKTPLSPHTLYRGWIAAPDAEDPPAAAAPRPSDAEERR